MNAIRFVGSLKFPWLHMSNSFIPLDIAIKAVISSSPAILCLMYYLSAFMLKILHKTSQAVGVVFTCVFLGTAKNGTVISLLSLIMIKGEPKLGMVCETGCSIAFGTEFAPAIMTSTTATHAAPSVLFWLKFHYKAVSNRGTSLMSFLMKTLATVIQDLLCTGGNSLILIL